jgi:hypothetical protein
LEGAIGSLVVSGEVSWQTEDLPFKIVILLLEQWMDEGRKE